MNESRQDNISASPDSTAPNTDKKDKQLIKRSIRWISGKNEDWQSLPGGCRALLVSFLFLTLGFLTIWIFREFLKLQQDVVLVAILLIPVLIYLILSGKLLEFSAGGINAKFNDAAQKPLIDKDGINKIPLEIEPVSANEKGEIFLLPEKLREKAEKLQKMDKEKKPECLILTVTCGSDLHYTNYTNKALLSYLQGLSRFRNFTFLVILRNDESVFAYIPAWRAIQILQLELKVEEENDYIKEKFKEVFDRGFAQAINENRTEELANYGLIKARVRPTDKTLDVLKIMTELNMDTLIVTDENDKLQGVVEREQVLSRLILAIAQ